VILVGLISRLAADRLPPILAKDLGDFLWPGMFYLLFLLIRPGTSVTSAALIAFTLAAASELLKRVHAAPLEALRANAVAGFLLGGTFRWSNFIAYLLGVVAASVIDRSLFGARVYQQSATNIPKVEHGVFCVLIIDTAHPTSVYSREPDLEAALRIEAIRTAIASRLINTYGGKLLHGYGSPLTALWPCTIDAPDPRALVAAIAITGALANPETLPPTDPASPTWGLTIGGACDSMLFQRAGKHFINVLGRAVARADALHDLAKERGVTLAIDAKLASLPSPLRWLHVTDDAWCIPSS
jgi:class 3 adenylate cyclase